MNIATSKADAYFLKVKSQSAATQNTKIDRCLENDGIILNHRVGSLSPNSLSAVFRLQLHRHAPDARSGGKLDSLQVENGGSCVCFPNTEENFV
jgi:hypothetical protein